MVSPMVLYVPLALILCGLDFKLWYMGGTNRTLTPPLINCIGERWLGPVDRKWREADGVFSLPELLDYSDHFGGKSQAGPFFRCCHPVTKGGFQGEPLKPRGFSSPNGGNGDTAQQWLGFEALAGQNQTPPLS